MSETSVGQFPEQRDDLVLNIGLAVIDRNVRFWILLRLPPYDKNVCAMNNNALRGSGSEKTD